jgi:hypothetical protein
MLLMNGQPGTSCEGEKPRRPAPRLTKEKTGTTTIYYEHSSEVVKTTKRLRGGKLRGEVRRGLPYVLTHRPLPLPQRVGSELHSTSETHTNSVWRNDIRGEMMTVPRHTLPPSSRHSQHETRNPRHY